jgi:U2 small nuclear ribonucleoprotein B''
LFENYPGFKDVNHVVQKNVAFIEFDSDEYAGGAMARLNGFSFQDSNGEKVTLKISFAKR